MAANLLTLPLPLARKCHDERKLCTVKKRMTGVANFDIIFKFYAIFVSCHAVYLLCGISFGNI